MNTTSFSGKPELSINIDRDRAADLNVEVEDLGKAISQLVGGQKVSSFEDKGKNIDVRVRLVGNDRLHAKSLQTLPVRMKGGGLTELRSLASVENTFGPVSIERQDRRRQVTVMANLESGKPLGEAITQVEQTAAMVGIPEGVRTVFTGTADMMAESFASMIFAMLLAVLLTYMIPITLGLGEGAESRAPMGACVVGGMLTSTILTLIVIPVVYSIVDDMRDFGPRLLARLRERPQDAEYAKISSDVILKSEPPTEHSVEADLEPASLR